MSKSSALAILALSLIAVPSVFRTEAVGSAVPTMPWNYDFSYAGTLNQTATEGTSGSTYWWVSGGGQLSVSGGVGSSLQGNASSSNPWYSYYLKGNPTATDNGLHPQNLFEIHPRVSQANIDQTVSVKVNADNLSNTNNRMPWNGVLLFSRYVDDNNFYYAGIRQDGIAIIKKKVGGVYYTLSQKAFLPGTWNKDTSPDLIPKNKWFNLRTVTSTDSSGNVRVQLYADMNQSGVWQLVLDATDNGSQGAKVTSSGLPGIRSDFMDVSLDNYKLAVPTGTTLTSTTVTASSTPSIGPSQTGSGQASTTPPVASSTLPSNSGQGSSSQATSTPPAQTSSSALFSDSFGQYTDGLITNEFTYWNPTDPTAKKSVNWEMTSGSLFASGGAGWSGVPNAGVVNALSTGNNNSSVFRLTTNRADFGDVKVDFDLLNQGLSSNSTTPAVDWDGVHVFLRYQSEYNLYYASINRRDNKVIIKKKILGGPSNNGTYYDLVSTKPHTVPYGTWQHVTATVKNNADGSVTIQLFADGVLLTSATDNGTIGGAPIRNAGKTGLRGDNANIKFKNFTVTSL